MLFLHLVTVYPCLCHKPTSSDLLASRPLLHKGQTAGGPVFLASLERAPSDRWNTHCLIQRRVLARKTETLVCKHNCLCGIVRVPTKSL